MITGKQVVAGARRWFADSPAAVWALIFGLFFIARLVIIMGGEVFQAPDSAAYAVRNDPARDHGPLLSFVGNAPRPWGLPLFYAIFGTDSWRTVGQWVLATAAWAYFAWEVSRNLQTRTARYLGVAGLLFLACLSEVASWDLAILTESLSISLGLLVLALLLRWLRTGSRVAVAAMTAAAVWWTFLRPDIRIFIVTLIAVLLLVAVRAWWRSRTAAGRVGPALVSVLVLLLGIVWYAAITPRMDQAMVPYDGSALQTNPLPQPEHVLVFRLRVDVSRDPELWQAFKSELGMPTCPELEAFTTVSEWREREWELAYTQCPSLVAWVHERKDQLFWTELFLKNPGLALRKFGQQVSLNVGGEQYASVPQVVPAPAEKLVFPSRRYGLPVALVFFAVALGLAWLAGAARRTSARLFWTGVAIFGTALLSAAATIAVHTGEISRYGVQEAYATRIATVILLACALDAWLRRRRGSADGTSTDAVANDASPRSAPSGDQAQAAA